MAFISYSLAKVIHLCEKQTKNDIFFIFLSLLILSVSKTQNLCPLLHFSLIITFFVPVRIVGCDFP